METRLNIFLFLAFIFILGLNYELGKDSNVAKPKKKTNFFEIQEIDSTGIVATTILINYVAAKVGNTKIRNSL